MYAMDLLSQKEGLLPDDRLSLLMAMPIVIKKKTGLLSDESMEDLSEAIKKVIGDKRIHKNINGRNGRQDFIATA
jgi:hypothetical protein